MRVFKTVLAATLILGVATAEAKDDKKLSTCDKDSKVAKREKDGTITSKEKEKAACSIKVKDLYPTQSAVGMDAVECKSQKITAKEKEGKLDKYLGDVDRYVPLVRGPSNKFYLTDHHHLSAGVWNAQIGNDEKMVNAYVIEDWSKDDEDKFWSKMEKNHDTWLKDPKGNEIKPDELPKSIGKMVDDPMRTLSAWVRNSCGYVKCDASSDDAIDDADDQSCEKKFADVKCAPPSTYFLEFIWGAYLASVPEVKEALKGDPSCNQQTPLDAKCLDDQYDHLVKALPLAMKAAADPAAEKALGKDVGYNPKEQTGVPQPKNCASN